jgi:hypothetical protein
VSICPALRRFFSLPSFSLRLHIVVDQGGALAQAVINDATITVADADRGTVYMATTNDGGIFNFVRAQIGTYQVKAEAPGFHSPVPSGLTLVLNQTARRPHLRLFIPTASMSTNKLIRSPQIRFEQRDGKEHNLPWLTTQPKIWGGALVWFKSCRVDMDHRTSPRDAETPSTRWQSLTLAAYVGEEATIRFDSRDLRNSGLA